MAWYKHPNKYSINTANGAAGLAQIQTAWADWETDANVHWQIASYNSVAPAYLVLKPKNGSAGRIMFTGGTAPASNYVGYTETGNTTTVYMVYDFTATSDTPSANYSVNGGNLFGTPSDARARLRGIPQGSGSYTFTLYANASAEQIWMWAGNTGNQAIGYTWGKLWKASNGSTPLSFATMGFVTIAPAQCLSIGCQAYSNSYANNLAATQHAWVYDPTANEGTTTAVHLVMNATQLSASGMAYGGQGSYTNAETHYKRPDGTRLFLPYMGGIQSTSAMARPSFIGLQSRYWGMGAMGVLDTVWIDNTGTTQGYYLGHATAATSEGSGISLLNSTF